MVHQGPAKIKNDELLQEGRENTASTDVGDYVTEGEGVFRWPQAVASFAA